MPSLGPVPEHVVARRRRIGQRVREERTERHMSQQRLGELVDLSRVAIGDIESGARSPRIDSLILISDALGVPLSYLVRE